MRKIILSILTSAILLPYAILAGCDTSGCLDNHSAIPLASFYNASTGDAVLLDSLEIKGVGVRGDSVLSAPGTPIDHIYLPMRSTSQATQWCIAYKWRRTDMPELNDTVTFLYSSTPYFASKDCGAMYRYHINTVHYTRHIIDSVSVTVPDSIITNIDRTYFGIYFRIGNESDDSTDSDNTDTDNTDTDNTDTDNNTGGEDSNA